jgi:hypothetical protein
VWNTFCEGKPNDEPLPVDPRTLVQPGVNFDKAVYFNAFWADCHVGAAAEDASPRTCGDYRARLARGQDMMKGGKMSFFGGDYTDSLLAITAEQYNSLWLRWGLLSRPADFDQAVANRWGVPLGTERNPYPLPGEDPNATNGGSGQLPIALTQLREADGRYSGKMGLNCNWCHSGRVGDESEGPGLGTIEGSGNSLVEIGAVFGDTFPGFPIAANKVRGTGDILLYPAIAALDLDRLGHFNGSIVAAPSQGSVDFPVFWNTGHRTRRFHDGSFAMDDSRPVMGFFMPLLSASRFLDIVGGRQWIEERDQDVRLWVESIRSPAYPGLIDMTLAEEGAWLFHQKDLWGPDLGNASPRPDGGNGSCASCHGVYSPLYAASPEYLDRPELAGIAAYVVPLDVIGTDPARANSLNEGLKETLRWSWWGYGTNDSPGACFGASDRAGYLAPPLHGIWASAPYFHNASVPNVWEVLKPSDRKEIWRRLSGPSQWNNPSLVMTFDTNLARAYDHDTLGWKYDVLECGDPFLQPALDCSPAAAEFSPAGTFWFTWNLEGPPPTAAALEERKIYNTHKYSQGNQGHEFTSVLTDDERWALIEFMKTL